MPRTGRPRLHRTPEQQQEVLKRHRTMARERIAWKRAQQRRQIREAQGLPTSPSSSPPPAPPMPASVAPAPPPVYQIPSSSITTASAAYYAGSPATAQMLVHSPGMMYLQRPIQYSPVMVLPSHSVNYLAYTPATRPTPVFSLPPLTPQPHPPMVAPSLPPLPPALPSRLPFRPSSSSAFEPASSISASSVSPLGSCEPLTSYLPTAMKSQQLSPFLHANDGIYEHGAHDEQSEDDETEEEEDDDDDDDDDDSPGVVDFEPGDVEAMAMLRLASIPPHQLPLGLSYAQSHHAPLSNEVVDFWINHLLRYSLRADSMHCFNSSLWSQLSQGATDEVMQSFPEDLPNKQLILVPVCQKQHWTLLLIRIPAKSRTTRSSFGPHCFVMWLDSRGSEAGVEDQPIISLFLNCLQEFRGSRAPRYEYAFVYPRMPRPAEAVESGVFLLQFLEAIFHHPDHILNYSDRTGRRHLFPAAIGQTIGLNVERKRAEIFQVLQQTQQI